MDWDRQRIVNQPPAFLYYWGAGLRARDVALSLSELDQDLNKGLSVLQLSLLVQLLGNLKKRNYWGVRFAPFILGRLTLATIVYYEISQASLNLVSFFKKMGRGKRDWKDAINLIKLKSWPSSPSFSQNSSIALILQMCLNQELLPYSEGIKRHLLLAERRLHGFICSCTDTLPFSGTLSFKKANTFHKLLQLSPTDFA